MKPVRQNSIPVEMNATTIKLLDYIEQMSHEMLNMAKAAELSDIANALDHVEKTVQKTYPANI